MQIFWKEFKILILLLIGISEHGFTQAWMPGYEFRKKITFNKSKIEGDFVASTPRRELDVTDFTVLIELQDEVFQYRPATACSGIAADVEGRNVAFATAAAPAVKLSFQIESYDPVVGKYRCWVKIPSLAASKTTTPATEIYFYYGGSVLHDNYSPTGLNAWSADYAGIWHMNGEGSDFGCQNEKTGLSADRLRGHGLVAEDKIAGKIGNAIKLDGQLKYLQTPTQGSGGFSFMAWVKWDGGAESQTIATTDSIGSGKSGWRIGINAQGKIEMSTYRTAGIFWSITSVSPISVGVWTHISCSYTVSGTNTSAVAISLNGVGAGGSGGAQLRLGPVGYMAVGKNKDGTQYFNGAIDELRLYTSVKPNYWLKNEYQNQNDPTSFYSVAAEEANASWTVFTGAVSSTWATTANWLNSSKPVTGSNVKVLAGKTARITGSDVVFGQLVLENGSTLSSAVNLQLDCDLSLGAAAVLQMDAGKKITLAGDGLNVSGTGAVNTSIVEVNAASSSSIVDIQAALRVSKALNLVKGKLVANGKLWLLASKESAAALLPVLNPVAASISGPVNVQNFVDGYFAAPSSGRGWRLLSSPVIHSAAGGDFHYGFQDIKNAVFVTGKAGAANGFDASPNNGATVYTHDQSLSGTLKEKYVPIPNINYTIPIGKGFYLFSRGSRLVENAYRDQIQTSPFVNPAPYLLDYTGALHVGDVTAEAFNRNSGEEGDGYNLLGNPYASPIKWGSLIKENIGPFVWMYDPLNQSYRVTDDPETVIPAGAGFFVKVLDGFVSGRVKFTEGSKVQ